MTEFADTIGFINDQLLQKPHLEYSRRSKRTVRRLEFYGDPREPRDRWVTTEEYYTEKFSNYAKVDATEIVEVKDLVFREERIKQFPERIRMQRQQFFNCDNLSPSISISMSVSASSSHSITFTKTVATSKSIGLNLSFSGMFGSASTNISFSKQVSIGSGNSASETETVTRTISANIPIPPNTVGIATLMVYETEIEVPFEASVVLEGNLAKNESGFDKASELLTEEERTIKIEGILRVQGVSDGVFRTQKLPGSCSNENVMDLRTPSSETYEFFDDGSQEKLKPFEGGLRRSLERDSFFDMDVELFRDGLSLTERTAIIGNIPDGVSYSVVYSRNIMKPDVRCGFNDIGVPNGATFSVEGRQYVRYIGGKPVDSWFEEHETYMGCFSP